MISKTGMTEKSTEESARVSCTRKLEFDYGHRVYKHESKCRHLHGHRGVVEITASSDGLDSVGRVIDFSVLKKIIGTWIDDNWDHNTLLFVHDIEAISAIESINSGKSPFILPFNPTAENMAKYLLEQVCPKLLDGTGVLVRKVIVHETPNCKAEASL